MKDNRVYGSIRINAPSAKVWNVLTDLDKIFAYTGSKVETDWKVGSQITWSGDMHGEKYYNKGQVIEKETNTFLRYTFWTGMGGDKDLPENYSEVSFSLVQSGDNETELTYSRVNIPTKMETEIFQAHLQSMLEEIKKLSEDGSVLRIERHFKVSPEVVFDTFTKPEAMRVWWTEDTHFEIALRVGGRWTITRTEEGETYVMTGEYIKVEKPFHLQHTIAMPQFSPNSDMITIDIAPDGKDGCRLIFVQSGKDIASELKELPEGAKSESEKGWQQGFDLMEEAWSMDHNR